MTLIFDREYFKQIKSLEQSIHYKAFSGELGTNDPSENAFELLKEIFSEQVK